MTTKTFASLGVCDDIVDALEDKGITDAFPIQAMTIEDGLAGRDVCGKAKTGSGKTLAFGIPVLERVTKAQPRRPTGLMLVPTRELAIQVRNELQPLGESLGVSVSAVYGGANMTQQINKFAKGLDVVVATPGRMIDLVERKEISIADIEMVVIDEADRMADMGFLPQVEWLLRHIDGEHQTLLFSATLDGVVDGLVKRYQNDPVFHEVESDDVTVEQMQHRFLMVHQLDKTKLAGTIAANSGRTLMFVRTKRGADRLTLQLEKDGISAAAIHGDLRQSAREQALSQFMGGELQVLVATDVAARGIHVDEIDVVIHFDPPEDHKTYLHRSGRTARAGCSGMAVTLVLWDQELEVKRLQTRIGVKMPIVEMFSNDSRLTDLAAWDPGTVSSVA